jgi:hypothetical protein
VAPDQPDQPDQPEPRPDRASERAAARARMQHQQTWVDVQLRRAREDGAFDDLPGYGKPLTGLGEEQDPDWWVKQLVEREGITVVPPALQLRRDDERLDQELDRLGSETEVRARLVDFNRRVRQVLYSTTGWPPVVTSPRDVEAEVERWRERLEARRAERRRADAEATSTSRRRRGLRRRGTRLRGGRDREV